MRWQDFKKRQSTLPNTTKVGNEYEKLVKIYLSNSPSYDKRFSNVWLLKEVPTKVREYLRLPKPDKGIDLICKTKEGDYWAIQAKYRSNQNEKITKKDLDSFTSLAFTFCRNISFGLACTPANGYGKIYEQTDKISFLTGDTWRNLDNQYFDILYGPKRKVTLEPFSPYSYQKPAVANAKKHFSKDKNGILIMPCGSGKSLTAYWIAKALKSKRIVVAVPSLYLVKQTFEVWMREVVANKQDYLVHIVCSDNTTSKVDTDSEIKTNIQDLEIPVKTDVNEIANWLSKNKNKRFIIFTTYQSSQTLSEAVKKAKIDIDFGIFDEAHKTVGDKTKSFAHLLFDKNLIIKKRMFMTATERFFAGDSTQVASMDDYDIYGEIFHKLEFREAIEMSKNMDRPILSDYRLHTIDIETDELEDMVKKNIFVKPKRGTWNKDMETRFLISLIALRKAAKKLNITHTVSFHSSLAKASAFKESQEKFSKEFPEYGNLYCDFISGKYPASRRKQILDEFVDEENALLTNARCLTEGIDVPKIDCILFADPRQSKIDIVQAMGRALRYYKGKEVGYVLLPIVLYDEDDSRKEEQYNQILKIIRQLASNDSRIIEYFKNVSKGKSGGGGPIEIDFISKKIDIDKIKDEIHTRGWKETSKISWMPFTEAREIVRKESFKNVQMYWNWKERPLDIPQSPHNTYKLDGFTTYEDWLGKPEDLTKNREYWSFKKARRWMHKINKIDKKTGKRYIHSQAMFNKYRKISRKLQGEKDFTTIGLPKDIKPLPLEISSRGQYDYKDEWRGLPDFLGYERIADQLRVYKSFKDARKVIQDKNLKNYAEWIEYRDSKKFPHDIHKHPYKYYKKEWKRWGDWLGNYDFYTQWELNAIQSKIPFKKAHDFVLKLKLGTNTEYLKFCRGEMPEKGLPPIWLTAKPDRKYDNKGWEGWPHFLKGEVKVNFLSYKKCKEHLISLGVLKGPTDYSKYRKGIFKGLPKAPNNIPSVPKNTYKDKWKGWPEFLGIKDYSFLDFQNSRKLVRNRKLKSISDYKDFARTYKKERLPVNPNNTYKNSGWISWEDFLGAPIKSGPYGPGLKKWNFLPFKDARRIVQKERFKSVNQYRQWKERPLDIPTSPHSTYKLDGFTTYEDWLGKPEDLTKNREYWSFKKARRWMHKINKIDKKTGKRYIHSQAMFNKYRKISRKLQGEKDFTTIGLPKDIKPLPLEISSRGQYDYKDEWRGLPDFLGYERIADQLRVYKSFKDARKVIQDKNLKNYAEWIEYRDSKKFPHDIHKHPYKYYKKEWKRWGDWLGNYDFYTQWELNAIQSKIPFKKAHDFVLKLKLKSSNEYKRYCKNELHNKKLRPNWLTAKPERKYKNKGWVDWLHFLGIDN